MIPDENKVNDPMSEYELSLDELENVSGGLTEEELQQRRIQAAQKLTNAIKQIKGLN